MTDGPARVPLYDPRPLGTKALQRLGGRLGSRAALTEAEHVLYEELIRDAKDRVLAVRQFCETVLEQSESWLPRLRQADVVGRVKTLSTLSDKLARTPNEKLPSIRDVAGVRVVADMSILEQQAAVSAIASAFNSVFETSRPAVTIDRIASPMHGYRALHLIVWPAGRPVEIQVRTHLQHAWAQVMEVLGDRWGREARYGLAVVGSSVAERTERTQVVQWLRSLSEAIAAYELASRNVGLLHLNIEDGDVEGLESGRLRELRQQAADRHSKLAGTEATLHEVLRSLAENFPE